MDKLLAEDFQFLIGLAAAGGTLRLTALLPEQQEIANRLVPLGYLDKHGTTIKGTMKTAFALITWLGVEQASIVQFLTGGPDANQRLEEEHSDPEGAANS